METTLAAASLRGNMARSLTAFIEFNLRLIEPGLFNLRLIQQLPSVDVNPIPCPTDVPRDHHPATCHKGCGHDPKRFLV
jgi:hypothetical protein